MKNRMRNQIHSYSDRRKLKSITGEFCTTNEMAEVNNSTKCKRVCFLSFFYPVLLVLQSISAFVRNYFIAISFIKIPVNKSLWTRLYLKEKKREKKESCKF